MKKKCKHTPVTTISNCQVMNFAFQMELQLSCSQRDRNKTQDIR